MSDQQIWQSDVAKALTSLKIDDLYTVKYVLRLLGLGQIPAEEPVDPAVVTDPRPFDVDEFGTRTWNPSDDFDGDHDPDIAVPQVTALASVETRRLSKPAEYWGPAEPLEPTTRAHVHARLPYEPLFKPIAETHLVLPSISAMVSSEEMDHSKLVDMICEAQPVVKIPWMKRRSLSRGVQLLQDFGLGMQPFRRDQEELLHRLYDIVGESLVETHRFCDAPGRGLGTGSRQKRRAYPPPLPGRTVLVTTSLGMHGSLFETTSQLIAEWSDFVRLLAQQNSRLVAFVPYDVDPRWNDVMVIVPWNRTTTACHVEAALSTGGLYD